VGVGDRVAESEKTMYSIPPAHGGDNTYRHNKGKHGVGRREASERETYETSKSRLRGGGRGVNRKLSGACWDGGFEEIPLIAVEVFEDGDGAVGFLARGFEETDAAGLVSLVIAPEVVGVEEEKDAAAGLIANGEGLFRSVGFSKEKSCAAGIGRSNEEPAFVVGKGSVLEQAEAEFLRVELESFVVVADNEG
jgi:hypothetical protein